jgi:hypothetical protein
LIGIQKTVLKDYVPLCRIAIALMIVKVYSVVDIGANAKAMPKTSVER